MKSTKFLGIFTLLFVVLFALSGESFAQENSDTYNPNSVYPISKYDQLFKKRVWRKMDLREKINRPYLSKNMEITRFIIDRVLDGSLVPYANDSCETELTLADFKERIALPTFEEEEEDFPEEGEEEIIDEEPVDEVGDYLPNQFSVLEIVEDVIFDRKRSRMYFDIQSIGMWLPAREKVDGDNPLDEDIAYFKYKDLENLFRQNPDEAIWFNRYNTSEHKNYADAFLLRMFHARITKVENPDDESIDEIYEDPKRALYASQEAEFKLMEMEHNLWEY
ncbi:MAG: gliding motility protein GldN [Cytophagales bacterium]|nr:gliding motility protein GldN [Cytophagales bacterium]